MDIFNEEMSRKIELIFKQAVKIFEPFWGCVVNSRLNATDGYLNNDNSFPKAFHWLNYLSDEMLERLDKKALNALEKKYEELGQIQDKSNKIFAECKSISEKPKNSLQAKHPVRSFLV